MSASSEDRLTAEAAPSASLSVDTVAVATVFLLRAMLALNLAPLRTE